MSRFDITQAFQQAVRPQGERTIEAITGDILEAKRRGCLLYTSPSPRDS